MFMKKKYVFKPYCNSFPALFTKEKEKIENFLPKGSCIEHVGTSSVPGLGGKGIIDIAIAVNKSEMECAKTILQELGYEFGLSFSTQDRFYLRIYLPDSKESLRRYHIHLTYKFSKEWKALVAFRDYLIDHPNVMQEYAQTKKQAAMIANEDGEIYRNIKEPLIQKIYDLMNT
jgi:GrpB-like predicted nucleotidyltransferase (UPF0157 family)